MKTECIAHSARVRIKDDANRLLRPAKGTRSRGGLCQRRRDSRKQDRLMAGCRQRYPGRKSAYHHLVSIGDRHHRQRVPLRWHKAY